ncbi:glycosyltransferase [Dietzia sp. Die43]|uniref:glycosyltransferase n=1 Tax=Dietzia sp. Die43 TaxID=2926011 RepID=UPI0035AC128B
MKCDAVLVHYGPTGPTVKVALEAAEWAAEVFVVANDLSDRPADLPALVNWIIPERNLGFGGAFNLGASHGKSELVAVLNNDIELAMEAIESCIREFEKDTAVAVAGPVLYYPNGAVQSSAGVFSWLTGWPVARRPAPTRAIDCDWLTGAVMVVRRSYWAVCPMDETYFLGCEDADYCVRARRLGCRVVAVPVTGAIHYTATVISGPRWHYYYARNHLWFSRANSPVLKHFFLVVLLLLRTCRVSVADLLRRRGFLRSKSMLIGVWDGFRPKPEYGNGPLADEPVPASWMEW